MTPHEPIDLDRLLRDAVDDVEPDSGIEAIRARTTHTGSPMLIARTWFLGGFGAAVATAAVITAVVVVGNDPTPDLGPGLATNPPGTVSEGSTPTETSSPEEIEPPSPQSESAEVAAYYVGPTERAGLRLFREWHQVEAEASADGRIVAAVREAVLGDPLDRDYRTYWPGLTEDVEASWNGDFITVDLITDDAPALHDGAGLTPEQQEISLQQAIYAAQGGLGQGRKGVQFLINGNRTNSVLGQPVSEPLANVSVLAVNNHVQLNAPSEGDVITGDTLEVSGAANGFEGTLVVTLQRYEGSDIVFQEPTTAGTYEDKLFPFSVTIDLADVAPGTYTLMASTDDASGGEEGFGSFTDDRVISIE